MCQASGLDIYKCFIESLVARSVLLYPLACLEFPHYFSDEIKNIIMIEHTFLYNTGLLRKKLESFCGGIYICISLNWGSKLAHPVIRLIANVDLRKHSQLNTMTTQEAAGFGQQV